MLWDLINSELAISLFIFAFDFGFCKDAHQRGSYQQAAFWGIHADDTAVFFVAPISNISRFENLTFQYRWTLIQEQPSQVFNDTFLPSSVLNFVNLRNVSSNKRNKSLLCIKFLDVIGNETCHRSNETLDFPEPFNLTVVSRNVDPIFSWKYNFFETSDAISFEVQYFDDLFSEWTHVPNHEVIRGTECSLFEIMQDPSSKECPDFYNNIGTFKMRVRPCATTNLLACGKWVQSSNSLTLPEDGIIEPPDFIILGVVAEKQLRIMNRPHMVSQSNLSLNCYYENALSYFIKYWGSNDLSQPLQDIEVDFDMTLISLLLQNMPAPNTSLCVKILIQDKYRSYAKSDWKKQCKIVKSSFPVNVPPEEQDLENKTGLVIILVLTMLVSSVLLAVVIYKIKHFYNSIYQNGMKMPKELLEIIDEMETKSHVSEVSSSSWNKRVCRSAEKIDPLIYENITTAPSENDKKHKAEPCDETEAESTIEHNPSSSEIWRESLSLSDANISSSFHERLRIEDPLMYVRHAVSHNIIPSTLMESGSYKEQLKGHSYSELPIHKTALPPAVTWRRGKSEQGITNFKCNTKFSSIKSSKLDRRSSSLEKVNTGMRSLQKKQQSNHNEINNKMYHPLKNDGPDSVYQTTTNASALPVNTIDIDSSAGNIESLCHEDLSNFVYTHVADNFSQKPIYRGNTNKLVPDDATMLINTKEQEKACVPQKIECNRPIHLLAGNDCFLESNSCQNTLSETLSRFSILRDGTSVQIINPTYTSPQSANEINEIGCKMNDTQNFGRQRSDESYLKMLSDRAAHSKSSGDELTRNHLNTLPPQVSPISLEKTSSSASSPTDCELSSLQQQKLLKGSSGIIHPHQNILPLHSPRLSNKSMKQDSTNLHDLAARVPFSKNTSKHNSAPSNSCKIRDCSCRGNTFEINSRRGRNRSDSADSGFPIECSSFSDESVSPPITPGNLIPVLNAFGIPTCADKDSDVPDISSCKMHVDNAHIDYHKSITKSKRLAKIKERLLKTSDDVILETKSGFIVPSPALAEVQSTSFTPALSLTAYDQNANVNKDYNDELVRDSIAEDAILSDEDDIDYDSSLSSSYLKLTSLENVMNLAQSYSDKLFRETKK